MSHLFRPADPSDTNLSPSWKAWRGLLYVVGARLLARAGRLSKNQQFRALALHSLVILGLLVQGFLILALGYMIDLSISLMDLWAELARKHLEITL